MTKKLPGRKGRSYLALTIDNCWAIVRHGVFGDGKGGEETLWCDANDGACVHVKRVFALPTAARAETANPTFPLRIHPLLDKAQ